MSVKITSQRTPPPPPRPQVESTPQPPSRPSVAPVRDAFAGATASAQSTAPKSDVLSKPSGSGIGSFFSGVAKAVGGAVSGAAKAVGNAVSTVTKAVAPVVSGAAKAVTSAAKGVVGGLVAVGKGVVGGVKTFATGVAQGVGGFVSNLAKGRVGDALMSVVRGADKALFQAPARAVSGLFDGAQKVLGGASNLLGPLGKPVREIGTRAIDASRTLFNTGVGIARNVFRTATETPAGLVRDVESSVKLAFQGKWGEAAKQLGMAIPNALGRAAGGVVDIVAGGLQGAASAVLTAVGAEKPSRPLNANEIAELKKIYGDSIDYDMVRVKQGGLTDWTNMAPHVVGNTIYMPNDWGGPTFNKDGTLTPNGLEIAFHEAGHVWQNQNGGGDYLHKALFAQAMAAIGTGSRNGAYNWREGYNAGKAFNQLNPEQQASLTESIGHAMTNDGKVSANDWNPPLSPAEYKYVMDAWAQVKRGEGAP